MDILALFRKKPSEVQAVEGTLDIAASTINTADTTRHNAAMWAKASGLNAQEINDSGFRTIVRNRARYEVQNNCHARAITWNLGNDLVGTGATLQIAAGAVGGEERAMVIEQRFNAWAKHTNFWETVRKMRCLRAEDGECFGVFQRSHEFDGVSFRLGTIASDRVNGSGALTETYCDGITYDDMGYATTYSVQSASYISSEYKEMLARDIIHYYRADRAGQLRGLSELTPALDLFEHLRQFTASALLASKQAADSSGFIKTTMANTAVPADATRMTSEPGEYTLLPKGWESVENKNKYPVTSFGEFRRNILQDAFRAVNMPYNVAAADSSGHNYSSGRLDDQAYRRMLLIEQEMAERVILNRAFERWYISAIGGATPPVAWYWQGREHIDPLKDAKGIKARLDAMVTTRKIECAKLGLDYKDVIVQRGVEQAMLEQAGLIDEPATAEDLKDEEAEEVVEKQAPKTAEANLAEAGITF